MEGYTQMSGTVHYYTKVSKMCYALRGYLSLSFQKGSFIVPSSANGRLSVLCKLVCLNRFSCRSFRHQFRVGFGGVRLKE
jgi:hypothetical protein